MKIRYHGRIEIEESEQKRKPITFWDLQILFFLKKTTVTSVCTSSFLSMVYMASHFNAQAERLSEQRTGKYKKNALRPLLYHCYDMVE